MSELILSVEEAMVLIAGKPFFEDLTFHIHRGRKIALVGKNGAGKTTLMNLITGEREIDDGRRWESKGITVGYMQQNIAPVPGQTVGEFVFASMTAKTEEWDKTYKIEQIIEPLGLKPTDRMDSLSGGLLRRAALARALVEDPDILLLDEPTNHLDLEIIEWLENFLKYYHGAVICVSHDRTFLANITDRVFWLDRGKLKVSPYGFARFEEWSQDLLEQEARSLHNRERKVALEMEWANRGVKARVKRNVRRVAQAREALSTLEADADAFRRATRKIEIPPPKAEESALNVAEFINVHKSFAHPDTGEKKVILEKFSLRIRRGDRIGILGKNGSGKTTLLKMLIKEMEPDVGKIKMAKDLAFGYFDQKRATLDHDKTLQQNLCSAGSDHLDVRGKTRHVCGYLKDFLFDPEDAWRSVKTLSGGQMNRLMLAKVLANPGSFLILDEPTNDLDMDTLDMLESILEAYQGTLFVVSHDRDFMDQIVDKLLVFEGNGKVEIIQGGYSDYMAQRASAKKPPAAETEIQKKSTPKKPKEEPKKSPIPKQPLAKMTYKLKYELEQLPAQIEKLEAECKEAAAKLSQPDFYANDPAAFVALSRRLAEARDELADAETRWLELEEIRLNNEIAEQ